MFVSKLSVCNHHQLLCLLNPLARGHRILIRIPLLSVELTPPPLQKSPPVGVNKSAPTRESPSQSTKKLANTKIHEQVSSQKCVPVACVTPDNTEFIPGVIVGGGAPPVEEKEEVEEEEEYDEEDDEDKEEVVVEEDIILREFPHLPPLWNAWWCDGCHAAHYVGDGGDLRGTCHICG